MDAALITLDSTERNFCVKSKLTNYLYLFSFPSSL